MEFCEYCGSECELLGMTTIELAEGVTVREEHYKCTKCKYSFYVTKKNEGNEDEKL